MRLLDDGELPMPVCAGCIRGCSTSYVGLHECRPPDRGAERVTEHHCHVLGPAPILSYASAGFERFAVDTHLPDGVVGMSTAMTSAELSRQP